VDRGFTDDGGINDIPWTAVFDPVANARALSAIQARGFSAASQLVDRFLRIAETSGNGDATAPHSGNATVGGQAANSDVDLILTTWWSLFGRMLRSMPGAAGLRGEGAGFDLENGSASGGVHVTAEGPGRAGAEVWLHNSGSQDIESVRLRCSDLLAHDGSTIGSDAVMVAPERFAVPGRSSRGIGVDVLVAPDVAPGCYRGTLLAEGYPELWLPVTLTLRAPAR
jgi:hypothetical protein